MKKYTLILTLFTIIFVSCKKNEPIAINTEDYHATVDKVVEIMVHDIFSPPVASRVFAYPNIAANEILAIKNNGKNTLVGKISSLKPIPKPKDENNINYELSALTAHIDLSKRLLFSETQMETFRDSIYEVWKQQNNESFENSKAYGLKVAEHIAIWMNEDNYPETRTMPKFTENTDDPSRWQPTPPSYMDGIEPHWNRIRPFILNSADQFKPIPPPDFSLDKSSLFYKELKEVYDISLDLLKKGDTSEEIQIAQFWDCNPFVSVTQGHVMFAEKKISPGAHWIGITKIACKKTKTNFTETISAFTKTSIAIADAFISCWDEKYRSNLIRPETLINKYIDTDWRPVLQTPPFPEYTSGHSVVSGAASTMLTSIFGNNFAFDDDTEVPYGLPIRSFKSFNIAAEEAAISRMYGGIHYRAAVEIGIKQGKDLGEFIVKELN